MTTQTRTAPATTEKAPKTTHDCRCGCGTQTRSTFAPGHDARLCSQLRTAYEAGEITRARALAQVKFSDKLTAKLARSLELADERKAAAKAAAKDKAAAAKQAKPTKAATPAPADGQADEDGQADDENAAA